MRPILIKDGCAVTLKGKENKLEGMTDKMFDEKDELAMENIYLALDEMVFSICLRKLRTRFMGQVAKSI